MESFQSHWLLSGVFCDWPNFSMSLCTCPYACLPATWAQPGTPIHLCLEQHRQSNTMCDPDFVISKERQGEVNDENGYITCFQCLEILYLAHVSLWVFFFFFVEFLLSKYDKYEWKECSNLNDLGSEWPRDFELVAVHNQKPSFFNRKRNVLSEIWESIQLSGSVFCLTKPEYFGYLDYTERFSVGTVVFL